MPLERQELSLETRDAIAIAESGGGKVSDFAVSQIALCEAGKINHEQVRKNIINFHLGKRK